MKKYRRVNFEDRLQLEAYLKSGLSQTEGTVKLGFSKSPVSREIHRNAGQRGHRPRKAERLTVERRSWRKCPQKLTPDTARTIRRLLEFKWSPQQIFESLRVENQPSVSHETIYQYVYSDYKSGGRLFANLIFSHRKRKPRFPRKGMDRRGKIPDALRIEDRPIAADKRSRLGHRQRDTMFGKDKWSTVLLAVDRKSRFIKLGKLPRRTASQTLSTTKYLLRRLPKKSMTNDRGQEFTDHIQLAKDVNMPDFFCNPYTSSERGTAENRIGVVRQYLPTDSDLKNLKHKSLQFIDWHLNQRPMKCLDWRTPYEFFYGLNVTLTT